jgi:hypothetical protein
MAMNEETHNAISSAMTAMSEAPGAILFYDVLVPDEGDCPGIPRLLVGALFPDAVIGMPGRGIMVAQKVSGTCVPMRPDVMRNMLKKWLAKLDDMYPENEPDKQNDEELTQRALDCGNFADVFEPGR